MGISSEPGALLSFSCLIAHSTSASMTSGSFPSSVGSYISFFTLLSSLYSSSEYSLHLFFIPSSSPIIRPSVVFREPILGVGFSLLPALFQTFLSFFLSYLLPPYSCTFRLNVFLCPSLLAFGRHCSLLVPCSCLLHFLQPFFLLLC